jgi:hypothetical protein
VGFATERTHGVGQLAHERLFHDDVHLRNGLFVIQSSTVRGHDELPRVRESMPDASPGSLFRCPVQPSSQYV